MPTTFNEFPKWVLTRAFTVNPCTVYIYFYFSLRILTIVVISIKNESTTKQKATCRTALENQSANI